MALFNCSSCGNIGLGSGTFILLIIGVLTTLIIIWVIYWLIRQMGRS